MGTSTASRCNPRKPRLIATWTNAMLVAAEQAGLSAKELMAKPEQAALLDRLGLRLPERIRNPRAA